MGRGDARVVHVVVECPRGSTAKLKLDEELGVIVFGRTLPVGVMFPFDFGFVPSTLAEDGDPLDAMIVSSVGTYPGVVVRCWPIAIMRASQKSRKKKGRRERNDRVFFIAEHDERGKAQPLISTRLKNEIETFFHAAVALADKDLEVLGWGDARAAWRAIDVARNAVR